MNPRYARLMLDFTFKKAFGTPANKPLMISLLNAFLGLHLKAPIVDVTYLRSETEGNTPISRGTIFDVYCMDQLGNRFITEVQMESQKYFADRALFYRSRAQSEMAEKGAEWDYHLPSLHVLGFLNFNLDESPRYCRKILLMDADTREQFSDRESFTFVEVPKFTKSLEECSTDAERWIYLFANLHKMEGVPTDFSKTLFQALFDMAEIAKFSGDELNTYQKSMIFYDDTQKCIDYAKERAAEAGRIEGLEMGRQEGLQAGLQEGRQEGRQEGEERKAVAVARAMLEEGMHWPLIQKVAGVSELEFQQIQEKYS